MFFPANVLDERSEQFTKHCWRHFRKCAVCDRNTWVQSWTED